MFILPAGAASAVLASAGNALAALASERGAGSTGNYGDGRNTVAPPEPGGHGQDHHSPAMTVGDVDTAAMGYDPSVFLTSFDYGTASTLPSGQTLRAYTITAVDKEIEIAPGVFFPAWTYNGRVPGPTLRCIEGDRVRVHFLNAGSHPHTIHFHGIHSAYMDGVTGIGRSNVNPGENFTYEFDAYPFGCHLYHCHSVPLKRHIHKGLYGASSLTPIQRATGIRLRPDTPAIRIPAAGRSS